MGEIGSWHDGKGLMAGIRDIVYMVFVYKLHKDSLVFSDSSGLYRGIFLSFPPLPTHPICYRG
jgi:hypothetical protein